MLYLSIHVISNHVATDKLATQHGGMFTNWANWAEPVSVTNHVKARQSLIKRSKLAEVLLVYVFAYFCILYAHIKLLFYV